MIKSQPSWLEGFDGWVGYLALLIVFRLPNIYV